MSCQCLERGQRHVGIWWFIHIHQEVVVTGVEGLITCRRQARSLDAELDRKGLWDRRTIGWRNDKDSGVFAWLLTLQGISRPVMAARENRLFIHFS